MSGWAARQDDGLEGVEGYPHAAEQAEYEGDNVHERMFSV